VRQTENLLVNFFEGRGADPIIPLSQPIGARQFGVPTPVFARMLTRLYHAPMTSTCEKAEAPLEVTLGKSHDNMTQMPPDSGGRLTNATINLPLGCLPGGEPAGGLSRRAARRLGRARGSQNTASCSVSGLEFRFSVFVFRIFLFRFFCFGFRVSGFGFQISRFGFRVLGFGFWGSMFKV